MKPLADFVGSPLEWVEPHAMTNAFELRTEGQDLVASLEFRSPWGSLATAETAHGSWTFKRVGFLNPHVTIRAAGAEEDQAVYVPKLFGGGQLAYAGGSSFLWTPSNVWQTRWAFQDAAGQAVVEFHPEIPGRGLSGLLKTEAAVTVRPSSLALEQKAQMAALGFYLIVLHKRDTGSAAAVVAATASS